MITIIELSSHCDIPAFTGRRRGIGVNYKQYIVSCYSRKTSACSIAYGQTMLSIHTDLWRIVTIINRCQQSLLLLAREMRMGEKVTHTLLCYQKITKCWHQQSINPQEHQSHATVNEKDHFYLQHVLTESTPWFRQRETCLIMLNRLGYCFIGK